MNKMITTQNNSFTRIQGEDQPLRLDNSTYRALLMESDFYNNEKNPMKRWYMRAIEPLFEGQKLRESIEALVRENWGDAWIEIGVGQVELRDTSYYVRMHVTEAERYTLDEFRLIPKAVKEDWDRAEAYAVFLPVEHIDCKVRLSFIRIDDSYVGKWMEQNR